MAVFRTTMCIAAVSLVASWFVAAAHGRTTVRVSVGRDVPYAASDCCTPDVSADGRYVVFTTSANNLVLGDTNGSGDVFVRDMVLGVTTRVSVSSNGQQGNSGSGQPSISEDGRFVAFYSYATNLTPEATVGSQIFVHDCQTGETKLVSVNIKGEPANGKCDQPTISGDGRWVAYRSYATNLVPDDTNGKSDVFLYCIDTGQVFRPSGGVGGVDSNGESWAPSVSRHGAAVAFASTSSNLVPVDDGAAWDIFVWRRATGVPELITGVTGSAASGISDDPDISSNGSRVVFETHASNYGPIDNNLTWDVYAYDRYLFTFTRQLVSVSTSGFAGQGMSLNAAMSPCGRYAVFSSTAKDLVVGDNTSHSDVFLRDLKRQETTLVSVNSEGVQANASSGDPAIGADGKCVVFVSAATNLVPGTVWNTQVYLHFPEAELQALIDFMQDWRQWFLGGVFPARSDLNNDGRLDRCDSALAIERFLQP